MEPALVSQLMEMRGEYTSHAGGTFPDSRVCFYWLTMPRVLNPCTQLLFSFLLRGEVQNVS